MDAATPSAEWSDMIALLFNVGSFISGVVLGGLGIYFSQKSRPEPLRGLLYSKQMESCINLQRELGSLAYTTLGYLGRLDKSYFRVGGTNWVSPSPDEHRQHLGRVKDAFDIYVQVLHSCSAILPRDIIQAAERFRLQLEKSITHTSEYIEPWLTSGGQAQLPPFESAESHRQLIASKYKDTVQSIRKSLGVDPLSSNTLELLIKV